MLRKVFNFEESSALSEMYGAGTDVVGTSSEAPELIEDGPDGAGDALSLFPEALDGVEVISGSVIIRRAYEMLKRSGGNTSDASSPKPYTRGITGHRHR